MNIAISPVPIWTPTGIKQATHFRVRYTNYQNGPSVSCAILLDSSGEEIASQMINATEQQTSTWTSDEAFYKLLAQNAGLNPL